MATRTIVINGRPRRVADMPQLLAEDYQPERANLTLILRRVIAIQDDLLRRGA